MLYKKILKGNNKKDGNIRYKSLKKPYKLVVKGRIKMNNNYVNESIQCTVQQCKYHNNSKDYCSLERIMVGTHEANPTMEQCTDCKSFDAKQGGMQS